MAPGRPAQRGLADVTAVEFRTTVLPRLGEYLVLQAMARTLALQYMHAAASWHHCCPQGALTTQAGGSLTQNLGDSNLNAELACHACYPCM